MAWSFGASGASATEALQALAANYASQKELWAASAAKDINDRQPQDQVLDPEAEQIAQVDAAIRAAADLLGVIGDGPMHVSVSGHANHGHDIGPRVPSEVVTVTVSSMG